MKNLIIVMGIFVSFFSTSSVVAKEGFPGRAEFPEIPIYSKADLAKNFNDVVIVDSRSALEFETLRIKDAVNISVANRDFGTKIKALRNKTKKKIVFYCNGRSCFKSYKAAKAAMKNGVSNVVAYDAGVFEWAETYPKRAVLLGENPIDTSKIISKSKFKSRLIHPKAFTETVRSIPRKEFMVMDVRDMYQRAGISYFPGMEKWVSLDDKKKLIKYLNKAKDKNKTLYIYDEAGKQVRWLQYTLERENIKNYFFMAKGAKGFAQTFIN